MKFTKILFSLVVVVLMSDLSAQPAACFTSANDNVYEGPSLGRCIVKGDFDNDGDLDVVVGNFTGNNDPTLQRLVFIENNGDATFQTPVGIVSGSRPNDVKASDFNNDGNLDLAVVNFDMARVAILLGNGDGTFQVPVSYATQVGPNKIAIADFNNDGEEDLAITTNSNTVNILLADNLNVGTFLPFTAVTMGFGKNPQGINVADFDSDGNVDFVTSNNGGNDVSVFFGDGLGAFSVATDYATDLGCFSVVVADLDGDLDLDIITSNEDGDNISVLINNGTGVFNPAVNYTAGDASITLEVNDLNNDGDIDVVAVNNLDNSISVFVGNGDGTLQPQMTTAVIGSPRNLVTGDFNADGNVDVVLSCLVGQVLPVLIGDGTANFSLGTSIPVGNTPTSIATADFNADGNEDFVVVNSADNTATVHIGDGAGGFTLQNTLTTGNNPTAVTVADLDGNGFDDVIVTNYADGNVSVFMNTSGLFTAGTTFNCNITPIRIASGNIDNDGNPDVAVLNENDQVSVLIGNGTGGFAAPATYATGSSPTGIDLGDANLDGVDDMVVSNSGANNVTYYQNNGTGNLGASTNRNVGTSPSSAHFGDLNNDGASEIITTNYGSNNVSVIMNNGSGGFSFVTSNYSSSDSGPQDAVVDDFDGDGNNDVMVVFEVSSASTGYASIFMGNGSGTLSFFQRFSTGMNPLGIVSADYNNDGKFDVAVVNNNSDNVSILLNTTASATALGPTTFCDGNSVDLQASPATSYLWSNSATNQTVTVGTSGSYTVQTTEGQSGWCTSTSAPISVTVNPLPTVTVSGTTTICTGETTTLTASGASSYSWDSGLGAGSTKNVSPISTSTYIVTGTDANNCVNTETVIVTVNALPDAVFTGLNATYCLNNPASTLVPNLGGGSFTGPGVSGTTFDPAIATVGTNEVKYIITDGNGCTDSTSQNTIVNPLPDATFTGLAASYCEDATSVTLNPATGGGTFSGPGVSGTSFDPSNANLGTNNIQYSVTDGNGCSANSSQNVTVNALPDADFNTLAASYCQDGNTVTLVPNQSGGTFSGSGVTGTTFAPASATVGSVNVSYNITDGNGCSNTSIQSTTVNTLPDASFSGLAASYCEDFGSVLMTPTVSGGAFSGTGVSSNVFNTPLANIGANEIKYIVTNGNGCTDSTSQTVTVNALPNTNFTGLLVEYCQNDAPTNLIPSQSGGNFIGSGVSSGQFDPSLATPGSINVTYSITDGNGCFNSTTESTTVYALPDASFTTLNAEYCEDATSVNLIANQAGGTFSGDGVTGNSFEPSNANIGSNNVKYVITDGNGCADSTIQTVTINALPDSSFTGLGIEYCQNEPLVILTPNEMGGTFVGNGIINGNEFHPSLASVGINDIQYSITNSQNCSSSSTQQVEILALPDTSVTVNSLLLVSNEGDVGITYQWIDCNNGNAPIADANGQSYEVTTNGSYAVVVDNGTCSDTSSCRVIDYVSVEDNYEFFEVRVYPNPNKGQFHVVTDVAAEYIVTDALGKIVYRDNHNEGNNLIDLNGLNSGAYLLQLKIGEDRVHLERIIINH